MPLVSLPASNTKRYKMTYIVEEDQHAMTARAGDSVTDSTANSHFVACFAALTGVLGPNVTWLGLSVAAKGSDVFDDTGTWTPATGTGEAVSELDQPRALCFPGRAVGGRKSKVFVWGVGSNYITPDSYAESPLVTGAFQGFQGLLNSQTDFWLAINGVKPTWYFRATIKGNDHWIDARR